MDQPTASLTSGLRSCYDRMVGSNRAVEDSSEATKHVQSLTKHQDKEPHLEPDRSVIVLDFKGGGNEGGILKHLPSITGMQVMGWEWQQRNLGVAITV